MLKLLIQKSLDNLLLENIEALAAGETGSGGACVGRGSVVCPLTKEESNMCTFIIACLISLSALSLFLLYAEKK